MFWKWTPIVGTMALASAIVASPSASADPSDFQYVSTVSGAVRCVISSVHVSCEGSSAGGDMNIARIDADGSFEWGLANIGAGPDGGPVTLTYDQTFHFKGWTVEPSSSGTTFTNDGTGHGMFVSIDRVDPF